MSKDKKILISAWIITIVLLIINIPKQQIRRAILAFLYKQMVTWLFGLLVVEKGLIKYPVRFFRKTNKSSFSFEYFIYPAFCSILNVKYPEKSSKAIQFLYIILNAGWITVVEVLLERYTKLIKYVNWKWYWSFITLALTDFSSRLFYRWFFKKEYM
ncbi:CBO0543 family protein [Alkalihalobacterium elongatum]|uniref:CBO0543 family protein n=1 Tax=Alkalihalobacterium elongatum TaxID=2675466 RepID=UPI001C1F2145|nr:CBO0543 family protein [Alkalihalobacterium elongatum]